MRTFDFDVDGDTRQEIIALRSSFSTRVPGTPWGDSELDSLARLLLYVTAILIDDPQLTADDREFSRALNADGIPNAPEYRHEFLMRIDAPYYAAWAYDHSEVYQARVVEDPDMMDDVNRGRVSHSYFEEDPGIVDRSLLRHYLRPMLEGETMPPPVVGRYAPKTTAVLPAITRTSTVPLVAG